MSGEKPKNKGGRPSKLTPPLVAEIVRLIKDGNYPEVAAVASGIDEATYYRWKAQGEEDAAAGRRTALAGFCEEVTRARAEAEAYYVNLIHENAKTGKDSRSAIEFLARARSGRWCKKDNLSIEHNGKLAVREEGNGEIMRRIAADPALIGHLAAIEAGLLGSDQPGSADAPGEQGPVDVRASPDAAQR